MEVFEHTELFDEWTKILLKHKTSIQLAKNIRLTHTLKNM